MTSMPSYDLLFDFLQSIIPTKCMSDACCRHRHTYDIILPDDANIFNDVYAWNVA